MGQIKIGWQNKNKPVLKMGWQFFGWEIFHRVREIFCFVFLDVFWVKKFFLKKSWIGPRHLKYYTTDVYPGQPHGELFFTKFSTNFLTRFTYSHLCALIFICENLFLSVRIFSYFWESLLICVSLGESLLICENLRESLLIPENPFLSLRISFYLSESVFICQNLLQHPFAFYNPYEDKQAYENHHQK